MSIDLSDECVANALAIFIYQMQADEKINYSIEH